MNNGVAASLLIDSSLAFGATGVTLTADVSGANARILYTTTATGTDATLKYAVIKWAA